VPAGGVRSRREEETASSRVRESMRSKEREREGEMERQRESSRGVRRECDEREGKGRASPPGAPVKSYPG
jgi:hypothetical protein